jgi:GGDEF domain-containing protein
MPDETPASESARPRRPRRFVVRHADDQRVSERIERFLSGPRAAQRTGVRRSTAAGRPEPALDTRTDFVAALHREAARAERYGRPATVVAVEFAIDEPTRIGGGPPQALRRTRHDEVDRLAAPIGYTLRREARDSDRVARVAPNRFHVLLPETTEPDARGYIERARRACDVWFAGAAIPVRLRIEAASTGRDRSLVEALATVEERLSA